VPVGLAQAALGATIQVPSLNGRKSLKIPAGTQSGDVRTMAGLGLESSALWVAAEQSLEEEPSAASAASPREQAPVGPAIGVRLA